SVTFVLAGGACSQNLPLFAFGHLEGAKRSSQLDSDLVELGRRDFQLTAGFFQPEGQCALADLVRASTYAAHGVGVSRFVARSRQQTSLGGAFRSGGAARRRGQDWNAPFSWTSVR